MASRARAMIPAAIGELALVPVCWSVHSLCKSVVTTLRSVDVLAFVPELKVVAKDDEQASLYQGVVPSSETELTLRV